MDNQHLVISGMSSYYSSSAEIAVPDVSHRSEKLFQILNSIPDVVDSDNEADVDVESTTVALQDPAFTHEFPSSKLNFSELNDTLNTLDQLSFSLERSIIEKLDRLDAREIEINAELKDIRNQIDISSNTTIGRNCLSCFGMPYFKTKKFIHFPHNEDDLRKRMNDELISYNLPPFSCWTAKEIGMIQKAVADCIIDKKVDKINSRMKFTIDDPAERKAAFRKEWAIWNSKPLEELASDPKEEFDWLKISIYTFRDRHSSEECQRIWHLYAKPSIIKSHWSKEEDDKLKKLAKVNNCQNWENIAEELNTGRSAYQCLVQYEKRLCQFKKTGKWTEDEDSLLCRIVDHCRIGSYIPWSKVMYYFDNRSIRQVFNRWSYSLNPSLKKGHFTRSEDFGLCVGVQLYGKNFCKIASILGNRSAVQIRERFKNKMNDSDSGSWTKEEDLKLIELFKKYGDKKWTQVSKHLRRNRTQCRLRYTRLKNKHNFDLDNIKRTVKYKPLHTYEKAWFKDYFSANGDEKSLREISKNLSLIKKRGRKGKSGTAIENQIVDYFTEAYSDSCPIFRKIIVKDELKFEEAAKALKSLLTLFKARLNFPKNMTEHYIRSRDTHQLADDTFIKLIMYLAKLYESEENTSFDSVASNEDNQSLKQPQAVPGVKISTKKNIDYNPAIVDIKSLKIERLFLRPKKSYNRASMSNLIYKDLNEFYVEPQPKNFFYNNDFLSALTDSVRENLKAQDNSDPLNVDVANTASTSNSTANLTRASIPKSSSKPTVDYLFPPNVVSLVGLRTFMLARKKLWKMLTKPAREETLPERRKPPNSSFNKLSFDEAHKLAVSRCASLLFWPLFLNDHSPGEIGYFKSENENRLKISDVSTDLDSEKHLMIENLKDLSDDETNVTAQLSQEKHQSIISKNTFDDSINCPSVGNKSQSLPSDGFKKCDSVSHASCKPSTSTSSDVCTKLPISLLDKPSTSKTHSTTSSNSSNNSSKLLKTSFERPSLFKAHLKRKMISSQTKRENVRCKGRKLQQANACSESESLR